MPIYDFGPKKVPEKPKEEPRKVLKKEEVPEIPKKKPPSKKRAGKTKKIKEKVDGLSGFLDIQEEEL